MNGKFSIVLLEGQHGDVNLDVDNDGQYTMPVFGTYAEAQLWAQDQLSDSDHWLIVCVVFENEGE
jgi:hypothetical protein